METFGTGRWCREKIEISWLSRQAFWKCQDFFDCRDLLLPNVEIETLSRHDWDNKYLSHYVKTANDRKLTLFTMRPQMSILVAVLWFSQRALCGVTIQSKPSNLWWWIWANFVSQIWHLCATVIFLVWSNFGSFANVYLPGYVQNTFDANKITLGAT